MQTGSNRQNDMKGRWTFPSVEMLLSTGKTHCTSPIFVASGARTAVMGLGIVTSPGKPSRRIRLGFDVDAGGWGCSL